jgi:hypothetical protein
MLIKDDKICKRVIENLGEIIDEGGYGYIYNMINDDKIVAKISKKKEMTPPGFDINIENKCISGRGCSDEIILEGLIMEKLNSLNSKHFVNFKGLYKCDNQYILLMEKLNGISYQSLLKQNINDKIKLQILFQITYALYIANTKLNFVHGDLISKNIMIENVIEEDCEYLVDKKKIYIPNMGIRVIIFDFGFSRINHKGWKFYQYNQQHYKNEDELFDGAADICKIYNNPTMALPKLFSNVVINSLSLNEILKTCKTIGWSYIPVPPFPKLKAIDILRTNLFDELYKNKVSYKSSIDENIGIEPIQMEKININEWLESDKDNIIIHVPNHNLPFCLKKSYFTEKQINNIYVKCIFENEHLIKERTYDGSEYINIGYYLSETSLIDNTYFKNLLSKSNIFKLKYKFNNSFISKEALLLSDINIGYKTTEGLKLKYKNVDAYFEDLYIKALHNYSYQWDGTINRYLLNGETTFEQEWFKDNYKRFGSTEKLAKENVKEKIQNIDKCFLDFAPRFEEKKNLFRGMETPYIENMQLGDKFEIKNYISTSKSKTKAESFKGGRNGYLYKIVPDFGIPYIDMISSAEFKDEREVIFPRGLIATCIKIINKKCMILQLSLKSKDQFKLSFNCQEYKVYDIIPSKEISISKSPSKEKSISPLEHKSPKKCEFKNKNVDMTKEVKRCPKGCVKNKKTKLCEPKKVKSPSKKSKPKSSPKSKSKSKSLTKPKSSPKKCEFKNKNVDMTKEIKRCPKGCVKNKKTKLCEPKKVKSPSKKSKPKSLTKPKSSPKSESESFRSQPVLHGTRDIPDIQGIQGARDAPDIQGIQEDIPNNIRWFDDNQDSQGIQARILSNPVLKEPQYIAKMTEIDDLEQEINKLKQEINKLERERNVIGKSTSYELQRLDKKIYELYDEKQNLIKELSDWVRAYVRAHRNHI